MTKIVKHKRRQRASVPHRQPVEPPTTSQEPRLLYDREEAARLLGGVCTMTLVRLEQAGRLTAVRLNPTKKAHVYYRADELHLIANGRQPQTNGDTDEA